MIFSCKAYSKLLIVSALFLPSAFQCAAEPHPKDVYQLDVKIVTADDNLNQDSSFNIQIGFSTKEPDHVASNRAHEIELKNGSKHTFSISLDKACPLDQIESIEIEAQEWGNDNWNIQTVTTSFLDGTKDIICSNSVSGNPWVRITGEVPSKRWIVCTSFDCCKDGFLTAAPTQEPTRDPTPRPTPGPTSPAPTDPRPTLKPTLLYLNPYFKNLSSVEGLTILVPIVLATLLTTSTMFLKLRI